jgi:DNA-binding SARP family transcriptional activator/DNA-binding beta-propeller fold protein YncE
MHRFTLLILTLLSITIISKAQEAYGLEFACKNISQESRTSLDLFPVQPLAVKDNYVLSFDLSFMPFYSSYFGYIFRITDEKKQNIDLIYNVHTYAFNVVTGNDFSGISFKIDKDSLYHQWNNIRLDINTQTHTLLVTVNGKGIKSIRHPVISGHQLNICFGANYRKTFKTFDVAPMRLKDVKISDGRELLHHWPLDQVSGTEAKDGLTGQTATIKNPVWLRPQFSEWQLADSFFINSNASVAINPATENVYITGRDSIYQYSCSQHTLAAGALAQQQGTPAGIRSVYDIARHQLCNLFPDRQQVALFDSAAGKWSQSIDHNAVTNYWHSNIFFSLYDSAVYSLGGYGDFRYKNEVYRYDPGQQRWDTLHVTGDFFTPRYLAAAGANHAGDSVYVLGGYGSITGDQLLNPHALYDLMLFDVKHRTFKNIYKLKEPEEPFAFASNMIINSAHQEYFALTFPNDRMNSSLQLIRGSLKNPAYTKLAAPLPYNFYDTKSAAYLFYCPQNDKLVAVTFFSPKNNITKAKIYTLSFSPYALAVKAPDNEHIPVYVVRLLLAIAIGFSLFLLAAGMSALKINKTVKEDDEPVAATAPQADAQEPPATTILHAQPASAIYLFGHFTVLDKEGNDITRLFSPLLKELFLLLFLHSLPGKAGISSEKINEILWPGRSVKDAKNNRSVNIVKLKSILDKTGAYTLVKENDKWIFHFDDPQVQVDLAGYLQLLSVISIDGSNIHRVADLVKRGAFLQETEYSWLDKFKADISAQAIPLLIHYLEEHTAEPEQVISICDCILNFDSLCEEAVMLKCKALVTLRQHASAKKIYTSFIAEYERIYGETFEMEYTKAIEQY